MPNRKKSMAELQNAITPEKELLCRTLLGKMMEILIPLGFLVVWIILQAWVLPRFGGKT